MPANRGSNAESSQLSGFGAWKRWFLPTLVLVLILDQVTKYWLFAQPVSTAFSHQGPGPVAGMPQWIDRSYNPGVAWGMFSHWPGLVAWLTALLVPVLGWVWWRHYRGAGVGENIAFAAILGGALGNGIDRLLAQCGALQGVRDFIRVDLHPVGIDYVWPTFNIADSGIFIGFILLALLALAKPKPKPKPKSDTTSTRMRTAI